MSDKDVLEKAIKKAIEGGWNQELLYLHGNVKNKDDKFMQWLKNLDIGDYSDHVYYDWEEFICIRNLIFSHDFAKALWGDKFINPEIRDDKGSRVIAFQQTAWRHHLRQMVVSDNPIDYLKENI